MDPENIKSITEWPTPRNVDVVTSLMGLASYYKQFIRNLSNIDYPITSLQRKMKKFEWTKECETSFDQLKHLLTNAQALKIVDPDKEFVVCTDACKKGVGGVLMYKGHVFHYESRKLNEHE